MRSDDAVETFKCHVEDEQSAGKSRHEDKEGHDTAVPLLVWRHIHVQKCVQITKKGYNEIRKCVVINDA